MMNTSRKSVKSMRKKPRVVSSRVVSPSAVIKPPAYNANVNFTKKFRFFASSGATNIPITASQLGALVVIGTSTTTAVQLFETITIKKVEMWATANPSSGANPAVSCTFSGTQLGTQGDSITHSDMSIGNSYPAHVKAVPLPFSRAALPLATLTNVGNQTVFVLNFTMNAVIDVVLDVKVTNDTRSSLNSVTLTTAVLGQIYYLALNNACGGTGGANSITPDANLITTT